MLTALGKILSQRPAEHPIFIVGGSRSGTIVLLKALGEHPDILSTPSENPFITDIGRMAYDLAFANERDTHYYNRTLRIPHEHIYATLRRLAWESSLGPHYGLGYLLKQSVAQRKLLPAKRRWCTKSFPGKNTALGLQALYPNARFIWILRNGLHVVQSRTKFPEFRSLEFREHCERWAESIRRFSYLVDLPTATVVHQEDLTEDPDAVFRRIFTLVELPYHPGPTQYALHNHVHPLDDEKIRQGVNVRETLRQRPPPYITWSAEQKDLFKTICAGAMAKAGYEIPF